MTIEHRFPGHKVVVTKHSGGSFSIDKRYPYNAISYADLVIRSVLPYNQLIIGGIFSDCAFNIMSQQLKINPRFYSRRYDILTLDENTYLNIIIDCYIENTTLTYVVRKKLQKMARAFLASVIVESCESVLPITQYHLHYDQTDMLDRITSGELYNPLRHINYEGYNVTPDEFFASEGRTRPPQISLEYFEKLFKDRRGLKFNDEVYRSTL